MGLLTGMAAAASIGGSILGASAASRGEKQARRHLDRIAQMFAGIKIPTIEEQKIILQTPQLMGQYTPEQIQAMEMSVSGLAQIGPELSTVQAQQEALEQLSERAEAGLTEADMAGRRQIGRDVTQSAKARRESILSEMAQRGVLGSGAELAAQLQGEQQSVASEAEATDRLLRQAEAARMGALKDKANLSGTMRGQESQESLQKFEAQRAIEEFNTRNRQKAIEQNVQERNRAQLANLQAQQAQEDARINARNRMEAHNKSLIQKRYQDELDRASLMAGLQRDRAAVDLGRKQRQGQMYAGVGSGLANIFGGMAGKMTQPQATPQPTAKKQPVNITNPFVQQMLTAQPQTTTVNTATPDLYKDPTKFYG